MKEIDLGKAYKQLLSKQGINKIEIHSYQGSLDESLDSLKDEQLYHVEFFNKNVPAVCEAKIFDSAEEILEFRKELNSLEDEEYADKTIVYEVAKGIVVKELMKLDAAEDYSLFLIGQDKTGLGSDDMSAIFDDKYYYITGESIHEYE